ncbi:hybrid sensor histidine kinase/response regulator [Methyloterricola oryzae]|uniref:hybrid sensor histidine kinase/response regulator n=1 Tax=Methyloterricola oryzae TaxID=1495050 RepID=UPI0005EBC6CB|nr:ATP-binding protein [Methyloterricola oryzae]
MTTPPQKILKTRRDYNTWVANEMMEDYALRYAPKGFRKWSEFRVANTALGAVSFLALEAIGGTLVINYGFTNAAWAILVVGALIFLTGLPISYYASRYNLDMDLLTRGAGFGYIGSTITSLIYASFTFIFFALEAAIMSLALELYLDIPLPVAYIVSSLAIIPLVTHGITWISRLHAWTQPLWLVLMVLPFLMILWRKPELISDWQTFAGRNELGTGFSPLAFGAAATVAFSLIVQIGEQVDFLRFLPEKTPANSKRWWIANLVAGPGWIVPGMAKQFGGAFLAFVVVQHEVPLERASEPTQMYLAGFQYVFADPRVAALAMTVFVVLSQVKINVTNAYAGSLAWSNFFSRLTHSHPGRVVWLGFNVAIAFLLMELGVFGALDQVLGLYSNVAIAWVGALVADLVVNKPLGLSPPYVEFMRAHLYDINPVGVGSMLIASALAIAAHGGLFGEPYQSFAPFIALLTAFLLAPVIAALTRGRFYIARERPDVAQLEHQECCICGRDFEPQDKTVCPVYEGVICSLCCSLDARCGDACKPSARIAEQIGAAASFLLPASLPAVVRTRIVQYLVVFISLATVLAAVVGIIYYQELIQYPAVTGADGDFLASGFLKIYLALLVLMGIGAWWLVLTEDSRRTAQDESNKQTRLLLKEIDEHRRTDAKLAQARDVADKANLAKSRFLGGMSHELRSPLNSILGYSEIVLADPNLAEKHREYVNIVHQSGEHLLALIDDMLDIARIESRNLQLRPQPFELPLLINQLSSFSQLEAEKRGLAFRLDVQGTLPLLVKGDQRRIRQILMNLLSNAVKFTPQGEVLFGVRYAGEIAHFEVRDTGIGIARQDQEVIFQPFQRLASVSQYHTEGTGLGLTVTKMLTDNMGGEITLESEPGQGSTFRLRLFLPKLNGTAPQATSDWVSGYHGQRRTILVTDDHPAQRAMLVSLLTGLGFSVRQADSGASCLEAVAQAAPDLVLMDLIMPVMDGFETARLLRRSGYQGPMIVVSANAYESDFTAAMESGFNDYIAKPVRMSELKDKLKALLGLQWRYEQPRPINGATASRAPQAPAELCLPASDTLKGLLHFAQIGYISGIENYLRDLEGKDPAYRPFVAHATALAKQYRLRELQQLFSGE